jgi:glycine hydroxymethyltransferase
MIMCKAEFAKQIDRAVFPGVQGGPHDHINAAKAVAFAEALEPEFQTYSAQVIKNAQALAGELEKRGYKIVSGGTDNHLMLVDVFGSKQITGKEAEHVLETVGISINKNMIPFDPRKPIDPSGIRLGTPAITTRGMASLFHPPTNLIITAPHSQRVESKKQGAPAGLPIYADESVLDKYR